MMFEYLKIFFLRKEKNSNFPRGILKYLWVPHMFFQLFCIISGYRLTLYDTNLALKIPDFLQNFMK